jgi:hypothetical protein
MRVSHFLTALHPLFEKRVQLLLRQEESNPSKPCSSRSTTKEAMKEHAVLEGRRKVYGSAELLGVQV